jgi:predicted DCC family thiol-disulfide oxidoreductase YuxK
MSIALTLYYDGNCPFCRTEMARLRSWDRGGRLAFVDIALPGFDPAFLNATLADLNREMVSQAADGRVYIGTDSILQAYQLVGRGALVWPLRVPGLRTLLAHAYRLFARHRYAISRVLGYRSVPPCTDGVCQRNH